MMKHIRPSISAFLLLACLFGIQVSAGTLPVPQELRSFLHETGTPGISAAIRKPDAAGPALYFAGYANVGLNVPVTRKTVFAIGSVTKLFTSLSILTLADKGELALSDAVYRWFPECERAKGITVEELIGHTSGMKDFLMVPSVQENMAKARSEKELVDLAAAEPLDFPHGTEYRYSNTGYVMLGLIVEQASGMDFGRFVKERIAGPLGMSNTRVYADSDVVPNLAAGYDARPGQVKNAAFASRETPHAAGNLVSTPADFVRLGEVYRSGKLLSADTHRTLCAPPTAEEVSTKLQTIPYKGRKLARVCVRGIEWVRVDDGPWFLTKNGVFPGYSSVFVYSPDSLVSVALSTNNESAVYELVLLGMKLAK